MCKPFSPWHFDISACTDLLFLSNFVNFLKLCYFLWRHCTARVILSHTHAVVCSSCLIINWIDWKL